MFQNIYQKRLWKLLKIKLIDFREKKMEKQNEKEVELFSSIIEDEVKQVCSLLKDNQIPFVRRDYGSGSYMNLYYGQSFQEKKIFRLKILQFLLVNLMVLY